MVELRTQVNKFQKLANILELPDSEEEHDATHILVKHICSGIKGKECTIEEDLEHLRMMTIMQTCLVEQSIKPSEQANGVLKMLLSDKRRRNIAGKDYIQSLSQTIEYKILNKRYNMYVPGETYGELFKIREGA